MDPKILKEATLAYQAVYDEDLRAELEEQHEFENWVNSLVEEGYDLSEYTWEEMYETYISEMGQKGGRVTGSNPNVYRPGTTTSGPAGGGMNGMRGTGRNRNASQTSSSPGALRVTPANEPYKSRFAGARDAAVKKAQAIKGSPVVGAKPAPTAPAAKPAASKPAPTAPAAAPKKTFNPLMQKTFGYQTGYAPDQIKNDSKKMAQMGSLKNISSSFDMFDIVKGYLIGEGYADTEDAAIAIMANMSEDWKTVIMSEARAEGVKPYKPGPTQAEVRADAAKAAKKKAEKAKGQTGYGPDEKFKDWKDKATPSSRLKRKGGEEETVSQRMDREKPYGKRMTGQMAREYGSRHAAEVTRVVKGAGEPQAVTYPRKGRGEKPKASREIVRRSKQEESLELYNLVLSHLINEGYASDLENAEAMVESMSDEWILSIIG